MPNDRAYRRPSSPAGLDEAERHRVLVEWNDTKRHYDIGALVPDLLSQQAHATPNATAIRDAESRVSYARLEALSSQVANFLRRRGVGAETVVGLCVDRSIDMIVGMLGIMKAGAAYLPLDPGYPAERLSYMLADAAVRCIITQTNHEDAVSMPGATAIRMDADRLLIEREEAVAPKTPATIDNLAYVIYTSGSTGRPKGVMVTHKALLNHMLWMRQAFPLGADDVVLQKTPLSFDASVWEILAPLLSGACLALAKPQGHRDPAYLNEAVRAYGVTTLQLVPSMLRLFLQDRSVKQSRGLRNVFSGGEALTAELRDTFHKCLSAKLHNLYGPTETCIQSVVYSCERGEAHGGRAVPIGRPIANARVYVLDEFREPVPIGAEGELYIGGDCLARGYIGRPELTAERFVNDPFGKAGDRLYRTGDLVRYRPDANLEFVGRADTQIKVSGNRVELGEVEAIILTQARVREVAVIAREDANGGTRLIAYVVASDGAPLDARELKKHLAEYLPEYMIPSIIVPLLQLPTLPNGKIDRIALEQMPLAESRSAAPVYRSKVQAVLADLWSDALGHGAVGLNDDFFDLGGTSLAFVQMFTKANERFGTAVGLDVISAGATLAALASAFETARAGANTSEPAGAPSDIERELGAIWAQVLGVDQVGPDDDFFDLGGTSLAFVQMFTKANERFETAVGLDVISAGATLAALASAFETARAGANTSEPGAASDIERELGTIWAQVFGVDQVGRNDDFFDLGGTSLALIRMFLEANDRFGTAVEIDAVSCGATIAALAPHFGAPLQNHR